MIFSDPFKRLVIVVFRRNDHRAGIRVLRVSSPYTDLDTSTGFQIIQPHGYSKRTGLIEFTSQKEIPTHECEGERRRITQEIVPIVYQYRRSEQQQTDSGRPKEIVGKEQRSMVLFHASLGIRYYARIYNRLGKIKGEIGDL